MPKAGNRWNASPKMQERSDGHFCGLVTDSLPGYK